MNCRAPTSFEDLSYKFGMVSIYGSYAELNELLPREDQNLHTNASVNGSSKIQDDTSETYDGQYLQDIEKFGNALDNNAFKTRHIQPEVIYGQKGIIAYELLSRPDNVNIEEISNIADRLGISEELDLVLCTNALKTLGDLPFTLNISVQSALSTEFWGNFHKRIERLNSGRVNNDSLTKIMPCDIIFEILEHDVVPNVNISHLEDMKEQGYRFALDDFSIGQSHKNRLEVFGGLVDFIKIDGPLIRTLVSDDGQYLAENKQSGEIIIYTKDDAYEALQVISAYYQEKDLPRPELIAEYVETAKHADLLFELGFTGLQGRKLESNMVYNTPEKIALANECPPCDHFVIA